MIWRLKTTNKIMGNGRTPLFSALVHMEEPLSPVGVAVPQKVN